MIDAAPAGFHSEGHRDSKRHGDVFKNMFQWQRKQQASPGAMNYAFETLRLVEFSPIGPSIWVRQPMRAFQKPLYVNGAGIPATGLGGVVSGQIVFQPLLQTGGGYA